MPGWMPLPGGSDFRSKWKCGQFSEGRLSAFCPFQDKKTTDFAGMFSSLWLPVSGYYQSKEPGSNASEWLKALADKLADHNFRFPE